MEIGYVHISTGAWPGEIRRGLRHPRTEVLDGCKQFVRVLEAKLRSSIGAAQTIHL